MLQSCSQDRVELCYNNQWGTICDDDRSDENTEVIWKQLKYSGSYGKIRRSLLI